MTYPPPHGPDPATSGVPHPVAPGAAYRPPMASGYGQPPPPGHYPQGPQQPHHPQHQSPPPQYPQHSPPTQATPQQSTPAPHTATYTGAHTAAPQSGAPQGAPQASPPQTHDYVLGVDVGTSHTVAVIRWPDGRARPLLVDGAPVMPSAVFLDESGQLHVGRDAQRLAQSSPARFEPNPKHHIDAGTVLLGDREIPVTTMLSAILRNVAAKAVETVGKLPPAVLTCPAKWGPQRRSMLEDAAAQAGFPPVKLTPEPVAAASYFTEVMRQPLSVGAAVAVFDFGGGTLDIAVVRHESDGSFAVLADGGLEDLGGLDVDSALVEHLGQTISANAPQVWQRMSQPQNGTDRRDRRLFWDDVRGAKEMLSRTTVAPVAVPGVEASLHLTRDELERLAGPLLERAVAETERVVSAAGQAPSQLAGVFLVGGASRMPMAARMLHSRLGVAPTALEQPELPVAEGSIAVAFPPQTVQLSPPPQTPPPGDGQTGFVEPAAAKKPWYKRASTWLAAAAAIVALALLAWWIAYDPYPQHDMNDRLTQVGETVEYPGDPDIAPSTVLSPTVDDDVAFYLTGDSDNAEVTAIDLEDGSEKWTARPLSGDSWDEIHASHGMLAARGGDSFEDTQQLHLLDVADGTLQGSVDVASDDHFVFVGDLMVRFSSEHDRVDAYDSAGERQWEQTWDEGLDSADIVDNWDGYTTARNDSEFEQDGRVWVLDDTGTVSVINAETGEIEADRAVVSDDARIYAYEGRLFVVSEAAGYSAVAYDLDDDELPQIDAWNADDPNRMFMQFNVCGETRLCLLEYRGEGDEASDSVSIVDFSGDELATVPQEDDDLVVNATAVAGETVAMRIEDGDSMSTRLYGPDFDEPVGEDVDGTFHAVDSGSFLQFPAYDDSTSSGDSTDIVGLGARDGTVYQLGSHSVTGSCEATDTKLTCPTEDGFAVWTFRD